jgi:queuine/archaeosine tRNA-ribosyltransferase
VHFYQRLMRNMRQAILEDRFEDFAMAWREEYTRDAGAADSNAS